MATLFSKENVTDDIYKNLFSRTTEPILTKHESWHKHPWVMGIQVCTNEELFSFKRGTIIFLLCFINLFASIIILALNIS